MYITTAYLYQQIQPVLLIDISGAYFDARWDPVYAKNLTLNLGVDNVILFQFQNQDQRPVNIFGATFTFNSEKGFTANGEFSLVDNQFSGDAASPVGFQMLQGLQVGKNSVWRLLVQKNITQYLDININYQGRKSETSQTIHTGLRPMPCFLHPPNIRRPTILH
jgi:hypothetical protein